MKKKIFLPICVGITAVMIIAVAYLLTDNSENEISAGTKNSSTKLNITGESTAEPATETTTEQPIVPTTEITTENTTEPTTEADTEDGNTSEQIYTDEELAAIHTKIEELKVIFPANSYWNHKDGEEYEYYAVTDKPCDHKNESDEDYNMECNIYKGITNSVFPYSVRGAQCLGFASLCSDYIFGTDTAAWAFDDYDKIQVGDQARISNDTHSVLIIEKTDEYIIVAECNADYRTCKIAWGRKIKRSKLENAWYIRRGENPEQ